MRTLERSRRCEGRLEAYAASHEQHDRSLGSARASPMKLPRYARLAAGVLVVVVGWAIWPQIDAARQARKPVVIPCIERRPAPRAVVRPPLLRLTRGAATDPWAIDLRSRDCTAVDLQDAQAELRRVAFDSATRWPNRDRLPPGFDPQEVMAHGCNPGLGVRRLHAQGVTGRGVGLAIIDQALLTDHAEYRDRLQVYEEMEDVGFWRGRSSLHGPAVASLAVGKSVGVAPEADLYYLATEGGALTMRGLFRRHVLRSRHMDFRYHARCIRRILRINETLPANRRIRAIVLAAGWPPEVVGYEEVCAAATEAREAGMLVVSSNVYSMYGVSLLGADRDPCADPDAFESYRPGKFWMPLWVANQALARSGLAVPMDARTMAGQGGPDARLYTGVGGISWAIPYLAGLYALAVQVDPALTPEAFWTVARATGRMVAVEHEGRSLPFGPIVDPIALVERLRSSGGAAHASAEGPR